MMTLYEMPLSGNCYKVRLCLQKHLYFVENQYSIADIALYAYTHTAHEGEYDVQRYPAIQAWLARVAATPGFITIDA